MSRTQYIMLTCLAIALFGIMLTGRRNSFIADPGAESVPIHIINQSGVAIEHIKFIGVRGNTTCEFGAIESDSSLQSSVPVGFIYEDQQIIVSDSTGIIMKDRYPAADVNENGSVEHRVTDAEGNTLESSSLIIPSKDIRPKKFVIKITDDLKAQFKSEWQLNLSL